MRYRSLLITATIVLVTATLTGCGFIGQGEQPPDGRSAYGAIAPAPRHPSGCVLLPGDPQCNALVTAHTAVLANREVLSVAYIKAHPVRARKGMTPGIVTDATAGGTIDSVTWTLTVVTGTGRALWLTCVNGQVHRICPWLPGPDVLGGAASTWPVGDYLYFRSIGKIASPADTRVIKAAAL